MDTTTETLDTIEFSHSLFSHSQEWLSLGIYDATGNLKFKQILYNIFRNTMMTSSNGTTVSVTGLLCGEFTGHQWITCTKASHAGFDVFFNLCLNKQLSKQSCGWWFETPSRSLWRQCNDTETRQNATILQTTFWFWNIPQGLINNKLALMKITAWRRTGAEHYQNLCWPSFTQTNMCYLAATR